MLDICLYRWACTLVLLLLTVKIHALVSNSSRWWETCRKDLDPSHSLESSPEEGDQLRLARFSCAIDMWINNKCLLVNATEIMYCLLFSENWLIRSLLATCQACYFTSLTTHLILWTHIKFILSPRPRFLSYNIYCVRF